VVPGKSYIDEKLDDLEKAMEEGRDIAEEEGGKFLTHLLSSQNLSMRQIYANVTELLLSGVDTVGGTAAGWRLFTYFHAINSRKSNNRIHEMF